MKDTTRFSHQEAIAMGKYCHGRGIIGWQVIPGLVLATILTWVSALPAQLKPEQAADMLLGSARRAYNEKNYGFATTHFKEFLARYGSHKEAASARFGLALALLESQERDYGGAAEQLQ